MEAAGDPAVPLTLMLAAGRSIRASIQTVVNDAVKRGRTGSAATSSTTCLAERRRGRQVIRASCSFPGS